MKENVDRKTVEDFGDEWNYYDQSALNPDEHTMLFGKYFSIFPWDLVSSESVGFDLGCGSGRWAKLVAPRIGLLHCIEPSNAIQIAKKNLSSHDNCVFHKENLDHMSIGDESMDFGYSLGVLHHIPDTQLGIQLCVKKLKVGAPFLLYLYYRFDNKPRWYRIIWHGSDIFRKLISQMPFSIKVLITKIIAAIIYFPLARLSHILSGFGLDVGTLPLSQYSSLSFYTMQTDALDRFGTRLEKRFTKMEIKGMMEKSGLEDVTFSEESPYWCAVGIKKESRK